MGPVDVRPGLTLDGTPPQHLQQPPQQPEVTSVMEADRYGLKDHFLPQSDVLIESLQLVYSN